MLVQTYLCLLVAVTSTLSQVLFEEEIPQTTTLRDDSREVDTFDLIQKVNQHVQDNDRTRSKRPFCNSFYGCGNGQYGKRKRTSSENKKLLISRAIARVMSPSSSRSSSIDATKTKKKRAFCNAFYGCGNGASKRSNTERNIRKMIKLLEASRAQPVARKRPFCNAFHGCANGGGKREVDISSGSSDESLERMNNNVIKANLLRNLWGNRAFESTMENHRRGMELNPRRRK
ncbi:uncharacterized protein LOC141900359 [Tubulanus polymorphus]|uniref:uncharacterized protein LOC141900359 n=1 Tax=Tubulanus polymorphus TaxID=672921 RepID=UPI003DA37D67